MVVLVEPRDGLGSCGHLSDRIVRIERGPAGEDRARDRQQAIANTAQGAAVAVTAFAQFGIAMPAARVVFCGHARPVIDGAEQPRMTSLASDDNATFAAAFGHRRNAGQGAQAVIVSAQRLARLGEQRARTIIHRHVQ